MSPHYEVGRGSRNGVSGWVAYTDEKPGRPGVVFAKCSEAERYAALRNAGDDVSLDEASDFADERRAEGAR